ncbi:Uncharacterised protein [Mycobacteroides abscessus subsp. abscessus]|nr:Uncharacterised protein [Mycobacteroides abscessus subsp. abscessus]
MLRIGQHLLAFDDSFKVLPCHERNGRLIILPSCKTLNCPCEFLIGSMLKLKFGLQRHPQLAHRCTGQLVGGSFVVGQRNSDEGHIELSDHTVGERPVVPQLEDDATEIRVEH